MKVKITEATPKFRPVSLNLTFESQAEVDEFYCLLNWTPAVEPLREIDVSEVCEGLPTSTDVSVTFQKYAQRATEHVRDHCI